MGLDLHSGKHAPSPAPLLEDLTCIQEGLFTILFAAATFYLLPNAPQSSYFLKEDEKRLIERVLTDDGIIGEGEKKTRSWAEWGKTFLQPHLILLVIAGFFSGATLSGLS